MDPVEQSLRQFRRRLWVQRWLRFLVPVTIFVTVVELLGGLARVILGLPPFSAAMVSAGVVLALLLAAVVTRRHAWDLRSVAAEADRLTQSRDRLVTYLQLAKLPSPTPVEQLALTDAREFVARRRLPLPPENWWVLLRLAPLAVFALALQLAYFYSVNQQRPHLQRAKLLLNDAVLQIAKQAKQMQDPRLEKVAEALQREAVSLSEKNSGDPRRAAVEALAKSEDAIRQSAGNYEDFRQAAQALAAATDSAELRDAVRQENFAKAAQAARQMSDAEWQRAIAQAAAAQKLPALESMREIPNPGEAAAKMMEQTGRARERNREMEKLLSGLQDLKMQSASNEANAGEKPDQSAPAGSEKPPAGATKNEAAGDPSGGELSAAEFEAGDGQKDGGGAGGDLKSAAGDVPPELPGQKEALANLLGEGQSLQDIALAGADNSEAKRRYQAIYQAVQSDKVSAVEREEVPARSRAVVKRYLESIRPAN